MKHILLLEDDTALGQGIRFALENNGVQVELCTALSQAQSLPPCKEFDLLILDVTLPDGTGFDVCEEVRRQGQQVPIIFLTARIEEMDAIIGFQSGGDDYVVKPFKLGELGARVEAHLRRESRGGSGFSAKFFENLTINYDKRQVSYQDKVIPFTKKEFDIIELLTRNPGQVFDKEQIYEKIWGYDALGDSNVVKEHIRKIRAKFKDVTGKEYIDTSWGVGYCWKN